jgi:hypothetical protein
MSASKSTRRGTTQTKRKPKRPRREPFVSRPPLTADEIQSLRAFVRYGIGDPHVNWWEENFLNSIKILLYNSPVWLSDKRQAVLQQLKDKLNYDRQHVPLPPIDPDGIMENDDPDGWPIAKAAADRFQDDELPNWDEA